LVIAFTFDFNYPSDSSPTIFYHRHNVIDPSDIATDDGDDTLHRLGSGRLLHPLLLFVIHLIQAQRFLTIATTLLNNLILMLMLMTVMMLL